VIAYDDRLGRIIMANSNISARKLDWKLLLLQGLSSGLGAFLGSLILQTSWGASLGAAIGALIAFPIGRFLIKSSGQ
jgi:uncharacterized membrane protein YfcA